MKKSIVWHVTSGAEFPIELWKHPKIDISVQNIPFRDYTKILLSEKDINVILMSVTASQWESIEKDFLKRFERNPYVSQILFASPDDALLSQRFQDSPNIEVLENPIHRRELRLILDKCILVEFYRQISNEIGSSSVANYGMFEGVFELAHREYDDAKKAQDALLSILDFEERVKKNNEEINNAMEKVSELRDWELVSLHKQLDAIDKLDRLKEKELKEALESKAATEKALQYSRVEEIHLDKIIQAQDRLFSYTEQEIKALIEENRKLKKELGIN